MKYLIPILLITIVSLTTCQKNEPNSSTLKIDSLQLNTYLARLSSDEFMGRMPFTEGEDRTVNYITEELKKAEIEPGNGNSYFQDVNLVKIHSDRDSTLNLQFDNENIKLKLGDDFVTAETRVEENTAIENSELVFAGYGIVAPEYDWNDYKGLDMKGKTAVVLVNDPGFATGDSALFKGNAMTYYGRWTYKYEEAARQGADGVIIVHQTDAAGYPWSVVRSSWKGSEMVLDVGNKDPEDCKMQGWITLDAAKNLFKKAGFDFDEAVKKAAQNEFKPFSLKASYSYEMHNELEFNSSKNVIGKISGSKYPDEVIIYTAHWDHLGIGEKINGDSIYNGAVDNATGVAAIMEIGRTFASLPVKPERTIVILAVTGEEQGLLGSEYYSENPIYPIDKTVANLNIDAVYRYGRTKDIEVIGYGQSEMDDYAKTVADKYGLEIIPDPQPEKGYFFRSDHVNFAKKGIPSFYAKTGHNSIAHGSEWGKEQDDYYRQHDYHSPSDNYDPEIFDIGGVIEVSQVLLEMGYQLSNERDFPRWKEGADFGR